MLVHSRWLSSLLSIASVTAHALSPIRDHFAADLRDRSLSTGTGVSLPLTTTPPYPTGSPNGTSIPTGSVYPTSSILSTGVSSTSTAVPEPTPSEFFLKVADSGTYLDGDYVYIGIDDSGDGLFKLLFEQEAAAGPASFSLGANGTLVQVDTGRIARYRVDTVNVNYNGFFFADPVNPEDPDASAVVCDIAHGALICHSGANNIFYPAEQYVVNHEVTLASVALAQTLYPFQHSLTLLVELYLN